MDKNEELEEKIEEALEEYKLSQEFYEKIILTIKIAQLQKILKITKLIKINK